MVNHYSVGVQGDELSYEQQATCWACSVFFPQSFHCWREELL